MAPACREGELSEKSFLLPPQGARQYHANLGGFRDAFSAISWRPNHRFQRSSIPLQVGSPHPTPSWLIPVGRGGYPDLRCVLSIASHGGGPGPIGLLVVSSTKVEFIRAFLLLTSSLH